MQKMVGMQISYINLRTYPIITLVLTSVVVIGFLGKEGSSSSSEKKVPQTTPECPIRINS